MLSKAQNLVSYCGENAVIIRQLLNARYDIYNWSIDGILQ